MVLERLLNIQGQVQEVIDGTSRTYIHTHLYLKRDEQISALHHVCEEMQQFMSLAKQMGAYVPSSPYTIIQKRLELLSED